MATYSEIIAQLESFMARRGINYSLANFELLLEEFGNPHQALPPIIHIAGTNGKGSTAAFIEAGLMASGKTVGVYTSPHLESYTERFRINGMPISEAEFSDLFSEMFKRVKPEQIATEFELLTLGAFLWFKEKNPDFIILETGLGGRLDATNVVTPIVVAITRIALDHQAILGSTISEIASEKAGIIKSGIPVVTPETQDAEAMPVIQAEAKQKMSKCILSKRVKKDRGFTYLKGLHQEENAGVALGVLSVIFSTCHTVIPAKAGMTVVDTRMDPRLRGDDEEGCWNDREGNEIRHNKNDWITAFDMAKNPGRFEMIKMGQKTYVFDGAHNESGIASLIETLKVYFPNQLPTIVTGILKTKDAKAMLTQLLSHCERIFYCDFWPGNSYSNEDIDELFPNENILFTSDTFLLESINGELVVVTGSLHFIGEIKRRVLFDFDAKCHR